jgi:DMSO/TMAO reductase YedYZ heme-binding membrane subunit
MVALPAVVVAVSGGAGFWLFTATRLLGLEAFTLIFVNIVTGAAGFLMALAHGVIVLAKIYFKGYNAVWVIGPATTALLAVTVFAAMDRKRLPRVWRGVHQINYLIFLAVFIKAVAIGSDVSAPHGYATTLKVVFSIYLALADSGDRASDMAI